MNLRLLITFLIIATPCYKYTTPWNDSGVLRLQMWLLHLINLPILHLRYGNVGWLAEDKGRKRLFVTSLGGNKAQVTNWVSQWQWLKAVLVSPLCCKVWGSRPCWKPGEVSELGPPHLVQFWLQVELQALYFFISSLHWFVCWRRGRLDQKNIDISILSVIWSNLG